MHFFRTYCVIKYDKSKSPEGRIVLTNIYYYYILIIIITFLKLFLNDRYRGATRTFLRGGGRNELGVICL